jgi:c-di-GMP-binding flagellar brake protein YcgR
MAVDKRDIARHKKRLTVRFGIEEASRMAFTEDVSLTGMFIKTANICPPNTRIRIEFEIADHKVELEARVMWAKKVPQNLFHLVKKSGMGVRFLCFHSGEEHFSNYFDSQITR